MRLLSKRMKAAQVVVPQRGAVPLPEAIVILKQAPRVKFDETVEVSLKLNTDPKQTDQNVRGTVGLPHGTGKAVRIAVICKGEQQQQARAAGADIVGDTDLIEKISGGWLEFDVMVATPEMMRDLSKLGKVLGPRGLMPNPKAGTVSQDVAKAVRELKAGKMEFRMDKNGSLNAGAGKVSFPDASLVENITMLVRAVERAKPASVKGRLIQTMSVATTMGPGVRVDLASVLVVEEAV
jgi:large subunit ribosomal protein L1